MRLMSANSHCAEVSRCEWHSHDHPARWFNRKIIVDEYIVTSPLFELQSLSNSSKRNSLPNVWATGRYQSGIQQSRWRAPSTPKSFRTIVAICCRAFQGIVFGLDHTYRSITMAILFIFSMIRPSSNPWGHFKSTWQLPDKISRYQANQLSAPHLGESRWSKKVSGSGRCECIQSHRIYFDITDTTYNETRTRHWRTFR